MTNIITGGAGFIGSHLCQYLLNQDQRVICVDNLITGRMQNIEPIQDHPNFTFINYDVIKPIKIAEKVDAIYHLASPASPNPTSPKSYHQLPFQTMQVNTTATWQLCELALEHNAAMLFASTSESYGDPLEHPQKETYRGNVSTTGPRAVYDEAKRYGETIVSAFTRHKKLNGKIVRIFNTYGPGMALDDGRMLIEFITRALRNQPLIVYGDGTQTRSLCYVSDLVKGIMLVMRENRTSGEIINLGTPEEYTVVDLAKEVISLTDSSSTIQFKQLPQDDPLKRKPDISKARQLTGWEPETPLEKGIVKMMEYVKAEILLQHQ